MQALECDEYHTSGCPYLPHPPSRYPIRKAHRVTPGQTIVTEPPSRVSCNIYQGAGKDRDVDGSRFLRPIDQI